MERAHLGPRALAYSLLAFPGPTPTLTGAAVERKGSQAQVLPRLPHLTFILWVRKPR